MQFRTLVTGTIAAAVLTVAALPAHAKCTRLGFSVNDYGKDGPTNDAKKMLDGYIAKWASEQGIAKYSTGTKSVKCDLFLDFIVFDEHTCRAEADVCWDEKSKGAKPVTAGAAATEKAAKAAKAEPATEKPAKKAAAAPAAPKAAAEKIAKPAAAAAAAPAAKPVAPVIEAAKPAAVPAAKIEAKTEAAKPVTAPSAGITTGTITKPAAAPAAATGPAVVAPGVPPTPAIKPGQ